MQSEEELRQLLASRLELAKEIQDFFEDEAYRNIEGKTKFLNKVKAEVQFLQKFVDGTKELEAKYLSTSNLVYFSNVIKEMDSFAGVSAVFHTMTHHHQEGVTKLVVDMVAEGSKCWVKVISRSADGICNDWMDRPGSDTLEQAEKYVQMARALYQVDRPRVVFRFCSGVPDRIANRIERMGIEIVGDRIPIGDIRRIPEDILERLDEDIKEDLVLSQSPRNPVVNLDVTSVFVLISNLTHPGGCHKTLTSDLLRAQALEEQKRPAREELLARIAGRRMIMCRTAHNSVMRILSTVAGPNEKRRAEELFKEVEIVEDEMTERSRQLVQTDKVNERNMTVFGTGDFHKAITVTANKHFVQSAVYQAVPFDVIVHPSRALSEKKEEDYVGPR